MAKITPDQIAQMVTLYSTLKSYAAVAKQLGVSASTVSKYVKANQDLAKITCQSYEGPAPIENQEITLQNFSVLTSEELASYERIFK